MVCTVTSSDWRSPEPDESAQKPAHHVAAAVFSGTPTWQAVVVNKELTATQLLVTVPPAVVGTLAYTAVG